MPQEQKISISTLIIVTILVSMLTSGLMAWYVMEYGARNAFVPSTDYLSVIEESETVSAVSKAMPAVVSVVVSKAISQDYFELDQFGRPIRRIEGPDDAFQEVGGGSGFIITSDGLIVTNRHVVSDESAQYKVLLNDGTFKEAKVVARDTYSDLALMKIEGEKLPTITFGDSEKIMIGQTAIAIGNALGEFQNSVTKGVISGVNRRVMARDGFKNDVIEGALQTDAAINQGNSGGPLVNLLGQVIGVNTAVSRQGQLIGFAIPSATVQTAVDSYQKVGRIVRPWLGVRYVLIDPEYAKANKLPTDHGALLLGNGASPAIIKDSPAEKAGLKEHDVITEVNGEAVTELRSLSSQLGSKQVGQSVKLTVVREGKTIEIVVVLGELPAKI